MATLVWDKSSTKLFETGVDRGVLYVGASPGVPWNGIISIEKSSSGGESESFYYDGMKYLSYISGEDFTAKLTAFAYPPGFEVCQGNVSVAPGLILGKQPRATFGLVYRTKLGNDTEGIAHGYRLHLLYNITAAPTGKTYETIGDSPTLMNYEWDLNAVPILPGYELNNPATLWTDWVWPEGFGMSGWPTGPDGNAIKGWKATPYLWADSTKTNLTELENRLYGTSSTPAYLPTQFDVVNLLSGHSVPYP